ncbi:DUF4112 domain-containing protein [Planktothrix agardhii]|jgi:hypothetical protein|uniref:DUF4112 domain-containing protein n=1 Tax=Planktothrix agardhii TaxID=1160 RepID=A0AAD1V6G7_PLAAG|nr:DUF4112 domain-containing protein [Planktothrix agardhii]BBD56180.1 hypothetical protein NIES204_35050 [Planktothrix agardhii NIES-204]MCB8750416.1 DUF4112 domain-containing protein [Planktothrix agardhii 1810]MCB8759178.1 DUF4112 domain-containing protein [Planktothrix agardhii 1813]MCB8765075.1 DUF4112 domain-containing protein [Planktothrix agardhii 1809]MCB8778712.1 DUF4112 domain-containing protein [Planktothrix agardhii 1031]
MKSIKPSNSDPERTIIVRRMRSLSTLLDNAIRVPGTSIGLGIDPILGLIPGGGDILGGVLSIYIVFEAFKLGLPRETLITMVSNIALETITGTVPVFGDIFDVAWKANVKNVELLEDYVNSPELGEKADPWFVFLLLGGLLLLIILIAIVGIAVLAFIFNRLSAMF